MSTQLELGEAAALELGNLLTAASKNPLLVLTDDFERDFASQSASVNVAAQNILDLTPPDSRRAQRVHGHASALANTAMASTQALTEGMDTLDGDKILEGAGLLEEAGSNLSDIQTMVERFCE